MRTVARIGIHEIMTLVPAGPVPTPGGVVEWLMAPVLKTGEVKASAGSNPAPSVSFRARIRSNRKGSGPEQASRSEARSGPPVLSREEVPR